MLELALLSRNQIALPIYIKRYKRQASGEDKQFLVLPKFPKVDTGLVMHVLVVETKI